MNQTIQETKQQTKPTTIDLDITAAQLEQALKEEGATIQHPVKHDPVAIKDGKTIAIWVT